ncbi:MAG: OmpW family outer membrane protein [Bdellovibrionota bacterium]
MTGLVKYFKDPVNWGVATAIAVVATVVWIPFVQAELVYENEAAPSYADRDATQQPAAQPFQQSIAQPTLIQPVPVQQMPVQQMPVQQMMVQPRMQNYAPSAQVTSQSDIQNLSKTELMRRERVREELKNEDVLQERLEDLRLQDERRRTDQVLGLIPVNAAQPAPQMISAPVSEQIVGVPVTERRADAVVATAVALPVQSVRADQLTTGASMATSTTDWNNEKTYMAISPRFGLATMNNTGYDIRPRYSAGVGVGMIVSDNVGFELGYTFNEYGLAIAPANPLVQYQVAQGYVSNFETYALKQNVFDAGLKLHVLGMDSRIRPYVGGGGAYQKSFLNYDSTILTGLNRMNLGQMTSDYQVDSFLGFLSTGLDVRASRSIMVGAGFKYYSVLSARENSPLNNAALYGAPLYSQWTDPAKQYIGGSLARAAFYSITGSVSFIF